jgi:hypothetical protein
MVKLVGGPLLKRVLPVAAFAALAAFVGRLLRRKAKA